MCDKDWKNEVKINVVKATAMHETRKGATVMWIKEAVPEDQFIFRWIQINFSGQ